MSQVQNTIPEVDVQATDVQATDVKATDVQATDVQATDVKATDVQATDVQEETQTVKAKGIELILLGHAFELGARGKAGGAPSKNSIWGLAKIGNTLVSFSGRVNAKVFKYKTHKVADLEAVKEMAAKKFAGEDNKRTEYRDALHTFGELREDLLEVVRSGYYSELRVGKVNNSATAKK